MINPFRLLQKIIAEELTALIGFILEFLTSTLAWCAGALILVVVCMLVIKHKNNPKKGKE